MSHLHDKPLSTDATAPSDPSALDWGSVLLWSALACCPFWLFQIEHFLRFERQATGFILFDMAYYPANGREIFERGNGFGYCNPYDPDPAAPVIYYHWLQWIYGLGIKGFGIDPGLWFLAVGGIGGFLVACLTLRLVEAVLPNRTFRLPLFLLVMWGGGILVGLALLLNLILGLPLSFALLRFDPFVGWWCLNWGRNLVIPTEAVYHACVAAAWLAIIRNRPWVATSFVGLLAATHPFSGIQHLVILGSWLGWKSLQQRRLAGPLLTVSGMTAVFLWYYFMYLPSFPEHQAIHEGWSLDWTLPLVSMLAAYLPVAAIAFIRVWQDRRSWQPHMTFFLLAAGLSFLLVHHDWFIAAKQPLHFTRGYVWMPLCLLGLPAIQTWLSGLQQSLGPVLFSTVAAGSFLGAIADNAVWLTTVPRKPEGKHGQVAVPRDVQRAFAFLNETNASGVILVVVPGSFDSNCLAATYTSLVPFIGHPFLTPDYDARVDAAMLWERTGQENQLFQSIDLVIITKQVLDQARPYDFSGWTGIHENDTVVVLRRGDR